MTAYASEDQIERIYERAMDNLDLQYTKEIISEQEYESEINELDKWVSDQYRHLRSRQYREW